MSGSTMVAARCCRTAQGMFPQVFTVAAILPIAVLCCYNEK